MASHILASIRNPLAVQLATDDINRVQILGYQINALENAIRNASKAEKTRTLSALHTMVTMLDLEYADFREDLEDRFDRASSK
jgi:Cu/Ag efflux pump CusA